MFTHSSSLTHILHIKFVDKSFCVYLQNRSRTQPPLPMVPQLPFWSIYHCLSSGLWKWSPNRSFCFCPCLLRVYSQHSSQNDPFKTQVRWSLVTQTPFTFPIPLSCFKTRFILTTISHTTYFALFIHPLSPLKCNKPHKGRSFVSC